MEDTFMVCLRTDEISDPVEGSTTTACVECGTDVWISAESRKVMHERKAMPLCSGCAVRVAGEREIEMDTVAAESGLSQGQMDEIIGRLNKVAEERGQSSVIDAFMSDVEDTDIFETMKLTAITANREMVRPDDEFGSMAVMVGFDGMLFPPIPISQMLRTGVPKEVIARQLVPACIQASQAKTVCFGMSAWALRSEKGEIDLTGPISEHPDRREMLVLLEITADGVQRMATADITRSETAPPRLEEWHDLENPVASDGLFVDAIVPTMQLVRTLHDS